MQNRSYLRLIYDSPFTISKVKKGHKRDGGAEVLRVESRCSSNNNSILLGNDGHLSRDFIIKHGKPIFIRLTLGILCPRHVTVSTKLQTKQTPDYVW